MDTEYTFHEYPRMLYRGGKPESEVPGWVDPLPYLSKTVNSADEELAALDDGWAATTPENAAPAAEKKAKV